MAVRDDHRHADAQVTQPQAVRQAVRQAVLTG
jgi:hypothetical protein